MFVQRKLIFLHVSRLDISDKRMKVMNTAWVVTVISLGWSLAHGDVVPKSPELKQEVERVFDEADPDGGLQRKFTIEVPKQSEDCFFLEALGLNNKLNIYFSVFILIDS